jgi:hypothetical protein
VARTAYEVYGRGFGWAWRLRVDGAIVAHGGRHYQESSGARAAIDRVRAATATLEGSPEAFGSEAVTDPRVVVERNPDPAGWVWQGGNWVWRLETADSVLAHSAETFATEAAARASFERSRADGQGALPTYLVGAEYDWRREPGVVGVDSPGIASILAQPLRGVRHRRRLARIDTRIVVAGSRGKSSTTRRLDDVFSRRGYDTLTKITGDHPAVIRNGEVHPLDRRGPLTRLYENCQVLAEFADDLDAYAGENVAVFENQGITAYTTRLINRQFVRPHVVFVTNVRQDHTDTLGDSRSEIARACGRSIPDGAHAVVGEQHPDLYDYVRREVERAGGTAEQVSVPERHRGLLGAETVHGLDAVLAAVGEPPLPEAELAAYLEGMQPGWLRLPGGRLYDASEVNDVESTELVRRALVDDGEVVTPFVFLRRDRRGRTASFVDYVNGLAERGHVERVHVGGADARLFASYVDVPATRHGADEAAESVLGDLFAHGDPVLLMGNTVDEFMRELESEVAERAHEANAGPVDDEGREPIDGEPGDEAVGPPSA